MISRVRTAGWWGLALMVAVACTADTGEDAVTSTSATTTATSSPATTRPTTTTLPATTTTPIEKLTVVEVVVREGNVISEERVDVPLNNRIVMQFDTDARLLVHVHGYDHEFWVEVGTSTPIEFEGSIPGIFEVEDHVTHRLLVELKVSG